MVTSEGTFGAQDWQKVLPEDGKVNSSLVVANVKTLLRADLICGLKSIDAKTNDGLLLVASKLYNSGIDKDTFCDNFLTTDLIVLTFKPCNPQKNRQNPIIVV